MSHERRVRRGRRSQPCNVLTFQARGVTGVRIFPGSLAQCALHRLRRRKLDHRVEEQAPVIVHEFRFLAVSSSPQSAFAATESKGPQDCLRFAVSATEQGGDLGSKPRSVIEPFIEEVGIGPVGLPIVRMLLKRGAGGLCATEETSHSLEPCCRAF